MTRSARAQPRRAETVGTQTGEQASRRGRRLDLLTEKVARHGHHLSREYIVDPLELARVGEVTDPTPATVREDVTVGELANRIASGDPGASRHQALPIVDAEGPLVGIITRGDVMKALRQPSRADATVLEAGARDLVVAYPDETVRDAVVRLLRHDVGRQPVVSRDGRRALVGYLGRAHVMAARLRWYRSEHTRERGRGAPRPRDARVLPVAGAHRERPREHGV